MPQLGEDTSNYEDDLAADIAAAYKEAAAKAEGGETPPIETAALAEDKVEPKPATTVVKDDKGRFAKTEEKAEDKVEVKTEETPEIKTDETPAAPVSSGPPTSWSVKSKSAWDDLPAEVKADIAKREGEVAQGFAALRDYKDLKPYAEMAKQAGVPLATSMKYYVDMEALLKKDVGAGLATIAQNCGLDQTKAAEVFTALAQKFGGKPSVTPTPAIDPKDPLAAILAPILAPLQAELAALKGQQTSRESADRNVAVQSLAKAIETFENDPANRYYTDLSDTMEKLFATGMVPLTGDHAKDLKTAYDTAANMVTEVREALIEQRLKAQTTTKTQKEKEVAARAKAASKSVTGSRAPGSVTTVSRPNGARGFDDIEDDVRAAYRQATQA